MNKSIIFALGTLFGASVGSVATYYIVTTKYDDELEAYSDHCEERIKRIKEQHTTPTPKTQDQTPDEPKSINPEDDKINHNEGVKKYHHSDGISSKYGDNNIFKNTSKPEEKESEQKLIDEIDEETFLNDEDGFDKQTIDILLGDDEDIVSFWGYGTDNETFVDDKFGMSLEDLIGSTNVNYDMLLNEAENDEEMGVLYLRNNEINKDFEVLIHDMREDDK